MMRNNAGREPGGCAITLTFFLLLLWVTGGESAQAPSGFALLDLNVPKTGFHRAGICTNFQQFFINSLPDSPQTGLTYQLRWWNDQLGKYDVCSDPSTISPLHGDIVPLEYVGKTPADQKRCTPKRNESFYVQGQMDQLIKAGASAGLFLLDKGIHSDFHGLNYLFARFYNPKITNNTPVFYMYKQQFEDLNIEAGADGTALTTFRFYRPNDPFLDAGVFVLLALATGCILVGSLWYAADLRRRLAVGKLKLNANGQLVDTSEESVQQPEVSVATVNSEGSTTRLNEGGMEEKSSMSACLQSGTCIHLCYTIQAFTIVVVILLLSFFYRSVAVEFFNVFVIIGGSLAMTACLKALVRMCIPDPELPTPARLLGMSEDPPSESCWIPTITYKPIRPIALLLFVASLAFAITWRIQMDSPYAFLMLDFMNLCICIYSVKASELKSLRLITFFLIAMFVYDIVMVFGTRLLTSNGCSVMVQVVTGMDCARTRRPDYSADWPVAPVVGGLDRPQKIPILFYVPLLSNPVGHCFDAAIEGDYQNVMMLGLGDVIAPGYLIAFAFYLDVRKRNRFYLYGFMATIGYALGMMSTFVSLKLMDTAQPALIYLVPFTLIPLVVACLWKGTLKEAWKGDIRTPPL